MNVSMSIDVNVSDEDIEDLVLGSGMLIWTWWGDAALVKVDGEHHVSIRGMVPTSDEDESDVVDEWGNVWREYRVPFTKVAEEMVQEARDTPGSYLCAEGYNGMTLDVGMYDADVADKVMQRAVFGGIIYA